MNSKFTNHSFFLIKINIIKIKISCIIWYLADCRGEKLVLNFTDVTTLLFDVDNTLILFDERDFVPLYGKLIYNRFKREISSYEVFMDQFLSSTRKMLDKNPSDTYNLNKFGLSFSSKTGIPPDEIKARFLNFYQTDFKKLSKIIKPVPYAQEMLRQISAYFEIVAATNPLFPAIANEIRLSWGNISSMNIPWKEITSADNYKSAKPHIEYYEELLSHIRRKPFECVMIGNDKVNDMVAGTLGMQTFLVTSEKANSAKIIKTELDRKETDFPITASGSIEELFDQIKDFIKTKVDIQFI